MHHVATFNIRSKWQDHEILIFAIRVHYGKLGHILKPLVPKFRPDLLARLRGIAEKQVPAKLKPIVEANNFNVKLKSRVSVPIAQKFNSFT